jgi:16S rRNA C967 or C1407 C5-methylase (RsmB/RsmF family)
MLVFFSFFLFSALLPAMAVFLVPRYIRINTLKIKRSEVHEHLQNEGWYLVPKGLEETYDEFLEKVRKLEDDHYLIDFNIEDILIFPSSSRRVWAHNEFVRDWQFILQDKVTWIEARGWH